jgi:hypothetical protein
MFAIRLFTIRTLLCLCSYIVCFFVQSGCCRQYRDISPEEGEYTFLYPVSGIDSGTVTINGNQIAIDYEAGGSHFQVEYEIVEQIMP